MSRSGEGGGRGGGGEKYEVASPSVALPPLLTAVDASDANRSSGGSPSPRGSSVGPGPV